MTKDSVFSADGAENLVTKPDNHFCFCLLKAFIGSSATTWYSENVRVRHEHPSCLEVGPSTIQGFVTCSKDFRSVCAIIKDFCFQYVDMTEEGDLANFSKTESCQHNIYELKRVEHFNPSFTNGGGGRVEPTPQRFFSITFEQNNLETSNLA